MNYKVEFLPAALRELDSLPARDLERVRDQIAELAFNPRPAGCAKLKGRDGWRIRTGVYRVLFDIDDRKGIVTVAHVGHRKEVYR